MFDPAAMGTLLIGLDGDRATHNHRRRQLVTAPRGHLIGIRLALAGGLRRAAERLERPKVGEVAS
jgi:hypothetical protein